MNNAKTNGILSAEVVKRKLRRMALEIAERNAGEKALIIAGISGNGEIVAQQVMQELQPISDIQVQLITVQVNKKDPFEVQLGASIDFNDKIIILVDDVANTGRTMLYALKPFLQFRPKSIQTLVLVERSHKLFPVQTDYVGLSIATTLQEHIRVETSNGSITGAWLH